MITIKRIALAAAVLASASAFAGFEGRSSIAAEADSAGLEVGHVYFNPWGAWPDPALDGFVVPEADRAALNWPETNVKTAEIRTVGGGAE